MSDSALATLEAIITTLKNNATLNSIIDTRVYTSIPQGENFPLIMVKINSASYISKTFAGMEHVVSIYGISQYAGVKEALNIRAAAYNALHNQNIIISGYQLVNITQSGTPSISLKKDGVTWHSIIEFRVVVV